MNWRQQLQWWRLQSRRQQQQQQAKMTTTTGKDGNNSKDNGSKDDSNDGEDNNNDSGNGNSGGGGISARGRQDNVRLVAVLSRALVVWRLHTIGIIKICLRISYSGLNSYSACLDMPNRIHFICTYSRFILYLFWSYSRSKPFRPILAITHWVIILILLPLMFSKKGGPVDKSPLVQIGHMTKVSTQIHSTIPQFDVYNV